VDFATYALSHLPDPPARILEIGCGEEGGVTPALVEAGYDALAVDPRAPAGARYRRLRFQDLPSESYDAVVAERVLHHVHPLDESLDKLAALAPLLVLDEFAWDRIDEPARGWYEERHRELRVLRHRTGVFRVIATEADQAVAGDRGVVELVGKTVAGEDPDGVALVERGVLGPGDLLKSGAPGRGTPGRQHRDGCGAIAICS
jgi:hypothetical protein